MKGIVSLAIGLALLATTVTGVSAHDTLTGGASAPAEEGDMPRNLVPTRLKDQVTGEDHRKAKASDHRTAQEGVGIQDAQWNPHTHTVYWTGNQYRGYVWADIVAEGSNCSYANSASFNYSKSRTFGNRFGLNGSFDVAKVRVAVGYDFTYSTSETISGTMTLQPRSAGYIQLRDWYDHTDVAYYTDYWSSSGYYLGREHGSGWTERFVTKEFVFKDKALSC